MAPSHSRSPSPPHLRPPRALSSTGRHSEDADPGVMADGDAAIRTVKHGHGRRVYWSFWMLGAAILLSWNVLIVSLPTLSTYFPPTSSLRKNLTSYIATVFTFGNFGILGLVQVGIAKANQVKRTRLALLCLLLTFLVTSLILFPLLIPALSRPSSPTTTTSQTLLFALLLILTLIFAFSTSLLQSSVIAIASLWGSNEMLGVMSGQGGVAVVVSGVGLYLSVVGALSGKVAGEEEADEVAEEDRVGPTRAEELAMMGLWFLAAISILGCYLLTRTILGERTPNGGHGGQAILKLDDETRRDEMDEEREGLLGSDGSEGIAADLGTADGAGNAISSSAQIFKKNIWLNFAVFYVFVVTLALFPPVTTTILSVNKPWPKLLQPGVFIPLHFFVFNISDFFGRTYMPTFPGFLITSPKRVALLSFSRTLFVPLFLGCNTVFAEGSAERIPWINSDVGYMLIVAAFGATTGYVTSLSMILSSSPTLNPNISEDDKHIAGTVAGFSLCAGLAAGSLASFGVKGIMGLGS